MCVCVLTSSVLHPNEYQRKEALITALAEMIWRAGQRSRACVCLPEEQEIFTQTTDYKKDGITEKVSCACLL